MLTILGDVEMDRQKIRERFETMLRRQMKGGSEFAEKCLNNVDKIIDWYLANKREITMQELEQIVK